MARRKLDDTLRITKEEVTSLGMQNVAPSQIAAVSTGPKGVMAQRVERAIINLFLAFHLMATACWCVPIDSPLIPLCKDLVQPYFLWAGLFQSWDMFAPAPKSANTYIEATLVLIDGSRKIWTFPRVEEMSLSQRFVKERYRKFAENVQKDEHDELLLDAARFVARRNSSPGNPVKTVILTQRVSFIVPRADGAYVPEPWESHILLGYGVRPEDLR